VRTPRELALSALRAAAFALGFAASGVTGAQAQAAPSAAESSTPPSPAWAPPPPIAPIFGAPAAFASVPAPAPAPPDRRLHDSNLALRVGFAAGFAPADTLDGALTARGYDASLAMPVLDLSFTARAVWWLFLGARIGTRWRPIDPPFDAPARERVDAAGVDALALAELRIPLGVFEISPEFGIGVGYGEILQGGLSIARAAPRVTLGTSVSVWIVDPLRFVARLGWDLYRLGDVNDFGHALSLGGPTLGCGLEWRPH
jgi:hypothetical protein